MFCKKHIESRVGIGARAPHFAQITEQKPSEFSWVEVHPENYMAAGSQALDELTALREIYPLSLHGVGLSLISSEKLDVFHLTALKNLIERFEPDLVSEHLAWSKWDGNFYNDLLPVPMTEETLAFAVERVDETQNFLGRQVLIENPSLYGELEANEISEAEFLRNLADKTGCGLLLDINNVFVSAHNLGLNAVDLLNDFPVEHIAEIHLAGHTEIEFENRTLCIDDHGAAIKDEVWALAKNLLALIGAKPILIERDKNIPALDILCKEAAFAQNILEEVKWNMQTTSADLQTA